MVAAAVEAEEEAAALRRSMAAEAQAAGSFSVHVPSHASNNYPQMVTVVSCTAWFSSLIVEKASTQTNKASTHITAAPLAEGH